MNRSKFYFLFSLFAATLIGGILLFGSGTARGEDTGIPGWSCNSPTVNASVSSSCSGPAAQNTISWNIVGSPPVESGDTVQYMVIIKSCQPGVINVNTCDSVDRNRIICQGTTTGPSFSCTDTSPKPGQYYLYDVNVSGDGGCFNDGITSITTTSSCSPALSVSCSPKNSSLNVGDVRTFTGSASGGAGSYTYQWSRVTCGEEWTCSSNGQISGTENQCRNSCSGSCLHTSGQTIQNCKLFFGAPATYTPTIAVASGGRTATDSCTATVTSAPKKYLCSSNFQCVESASGTDLATCQNTCKAPTNGSILIKRVDANLNSIPSSIISASTRGNVDRSVGASCADPNDSVCNNNPSLFSGYVGAGSHGITATALSGFTQSVATCEYTIGQSECSLTSASDYSSSCSVSGSDCWFTASVTAGKVRKVVYKYIPLPTCLIAGQTAGQTNVRVGDHFVIPWNNSPNLQTLISSGWSGPITCVGDESICNAIHSRIGLPACPPESGKCSWGGHNGSYLVFGEPGTSNVTITATDVAGQQGSCRHSVTATAGPIATGVIDINATLDGATWTGPVTYTLNPTGDTRTSVGSPTSFTKNPGAYSVTRNSGGPAGKNFKGFNTSCGSTGSGNTSGSCNLTAENRLTFTMVFESSTVTNQLPTGVHDANNNVACQVEGWTADPDNRTIDLKVNIYSDGTFVRDDIANRFRPDLQSAGVCPDGTCAFVTSLAGMISSGVSHSIRVRALDAQTNEEVNLSGTPKPITCSAAPVNGACGSANGVPSPTPPTANLCSQGTPTGVTDSGTSWAWSCQGSNGGSAANCSAPKTVTATCDTSYPDNTFHVCYFDGTNPPTGANPVLAQNNESTIDHDWGAGQVNATGKSDQVSGIWRGRINFAAGNYVFHTLSDDGVLLNLEGFGDIISNWTDHRTIQNNSSSITLPAGSRNVTLKWYENGGGARVKLWWDVISAVANNASCENMSAPNAVTVGQTFNASVTMRNTGTKIWTTDSTPHRLGSQNPQDNTRWRDGRVALPNNVVPNANVTFNFNNTAPSAPGTYPFEWKMVEDGVEWFGQTCTKTITVNPAGSQISGFCEASPNPITQNGSTVWTAFFSGGAAPYTYSWSGTDGFTGGGMSAGWTYPSSGTKQATVAVTDSVGSGKQIACSSLVVQERGRPPACSDGIDNDGDGKIDYPADPGCSSPGDTDETDFCSNECASGSRQCIGASSYQVCGNFDADSCLEWGPTPPNSCPAGQQCISGSCAALPPNPPASFSASAGPACNVVNFFWTDTNSPPADSFTISCNSGTTTISGLTGSSYTFTGAEGNTAYNCAITATRSGLSSSARPLNTGSVTTPKCPDFGLVNLDFNGSGDTLSVILITSGSPKDTNKIALSVTNAGTSFSGDVGLSLQSITGAAGVFGKTAHFGVSGAPTTTLAPGQSAPFWLTVSGAQPVGAYNGFVNIKGFAPSLGISHTIVVPLKVEVKSPGFEEI